MVDRTQTQEKIQVRDVLRAKVLCVSLLDYSKGVGLPRRPCRCLWAGGVVEGRVEDQRRGRGSMCSSLGGSSRWRPRFTCRLVCRYHLEEGCILSRSYVITVNVQCLGPMFFSIFYSTLGCLYIVRFLGVIVKCGYSVIVDFYWLPSWT